MERVIRGKGHAIGFGAITEIPVRAPDAAAARDVPKLLASPEGKDAFVAVGVD